MIKALNGLILLTFLGLAGCGRTDLSRSDAQAFIAKSPQVEELTNQVLITSQAIANGRTQGMWDQDRNGRIAPRAAAAQEIKTITGRAIDPITKPTINIDITGIADSPISDKIKEAQFSWAYDALTPIVRRFAVNGGEGKATFRQFDDGWRLDGVQIRHLDKPLQLSSTELREIEQDVARQSAELEEVRRFVESSWTPSRRVKEFELAAGENPARAAKYGPMRIIITDVDVSYGAGSQLQTVWYGHVRDVGIAPRGQIYLNNRNLVGAYIYEHPNMNAQDVLSALVPAVEAWRSKYRDQLPGNVYDLYLAAKKNRR